MAVLRVASLRRHPGKDLPLLPLRFFVTRSTPPQEVPPTPSSPSHFSNQFPLTLLPAPSCFFHNALPFFPLVYPWRYRSRPINDGREKVLDFFQAMYDLFFQAFETSSLLPHVPPCFFVFKFSVLDMPPLGPVSQTATHPPHRSLCCQS